MIRGRRAPVGVDGSGSALLWFFDATEMRAEAEQADAEAARLRDAFEALTGLIEAAPLPMWYRGPDLRLAMVHLAYRSEGRRGGKEGVSTCRSRWAPTPDNK